MAVARGLPGPSGQMVICTGTGPVMVSVDADGAPVGTPHICPDAALSLIQAAFDSPVPSRPVTLAPLAYVTPAKESSQGQDFRQAQARGPPRMA